jgi:hypothetical protein
MRGVARYNSSGPRDLVIMSRTQHEDRFTSASDRYRALFGVSDAIASHRELSALFHELAERLRRAVRFNALSLVLHE